MSDGSEYEFQTVQLPMDEHIQEAAEAKRQQGWVLNPAEGTPTVTYHLMRKKGATGPASMFGGLVKSELKANDKLIFTKKADGRVLRADGSEIPGADIDAEVARVNAAESEMRSELAGDDEPTQG